MDDYTRGWLDADEAIAHKLPGHHDYSQGTSEWDEGWNVRRGLERGEGVNSMEAQNVVAYASEWAEEARNALERANGGWDSKEVGASVQSRATAQHPMYLGIVNAVTYDSKNDRYIAKFGDSSAKVTDDVAQFLITEGATGGKDMRPTVYAHMTKGTIDAVLLLFIHRS